VKLNFGNRNPMFSNPNLKAFFIGVYIFLWMISIFIYTINTIIIYQIKKNRRWPIFKSYIRYYLQQQLLHVFLTAFLAAGFLTAFFLTTIRIYNKKIKITFYLRDSLIMNI